MLNVLDGAAYLERMLSLPRPGAEAIHAFYDHRVGAVCKDPSRMLVPMDDHLVHRGDGVFESLKYIDRRIYQIQPHVDRLRRSAESIHLAPPCDWGDIPDIIVGLAKAADKPLGYIRLLLGRGPGGFGIHPGECPVASLYLVAYKFTLKTEEHFARGVTACRASTPAKQGYMAKIKSVNYLPNMLMKREAAARGYDFPLCFDERGYLAEGAIENVCLVDEDGVLLVPEFTNSLTGTTLMRGLELVGDEIEVRFESVTEEQVYAARELIVVGTTEDAVSVVKYNDHVVGDGKPGPVSKLMRQKLIKDLHENGTPF